MPRRTAYVTIDQEGRDEGKTFLLTEMSCGDAEDWAGEAFFAIARGGINVPDGIEEMGMAGLATLTLKSLGGVAWRDAKPLMDKMMECVEICPDMQNNPKFHRALVENDIEEVSTRFALRVEAFKLHVNFSSIALLSRLKRAAE